MQQLRGYVSKAHDGEKLFAGSVRIKAGPHTGARRMEMLWNAMAPGQSTGTHVHNRSDELFYVIRGRGTAFVNGSDASLESGDVIFIPKGEDHRIRSSSDDPLEVVFVGDEAGLASEFREAHALFAAGKWPPTLEEVNAITEKHGTTYKSLD